MLLFAKCEPNLAYVYPALMLGHGALHQSGNVVAPIPDRSETVRDLQPHHHLDDPVGENFAGVIGGSVFHLSAQRAGSGEMAADCRTNLRLCCT